MLQETLARAGMPFLIFRLLSSLYSDNKITLDVEKDADARWHKVNCGVRQGCTIATLLIPVVANPLIELLASQSAIEVPGLDSNLSPLTESVPHRNFNQLWLADDAAVLSESIPI